LNFFLQLARQGIQINTADQPTNRTRTHLGTERARSEFAQCTVLRLRDDAQDLDFVQAIELILLFPYKCIKLALRFVVATGACLLATCSR
jgi:hypothetical protein